MGLFRETGVIKAFRSYFLITRICFTFYTLGSKIKRRHFHIVTQGADEIFSPSPLPSPGSVTILGFAAYFGLIELVLLLAICES